MLAELKQRQKKKMSEFVINGNKCFITNASYANHLALTAVTDEKAREKGNQCNHRTNQCSRVFTSSITMKKWA